MAQARSYALQLGLPSFGVAAPEAVRVYSLSRNQERLEMEVAGDRLGAQADGIRSLLLRLRL